MNNKQKIMELKEKGKKIIEISKELGVATSTVRYHLNPDYRKQLIETGKLKFKNLTPEQRKEYNLSRKEYNKNYQRRRYKEDPEFRLKKIEMVKERRCHLKSLNPLSKKI